MGHSSPFRLPQSKKNGICPVIPATLRQMPQLSLLLQGKIRCPSRNTVYIVFCPIFFLMRTDLFRVRYHVYNKLDIGITIVCTCTTGKKMTAQQLLQDWLAYENLRKHTWPSSKSVRSKLFGDVDSCVLRSWINMFLPFSGVYDGEFRVYASTDTGNKHFCQEDHQWKRDIFVTVSLLLFFRWTISESSETAPYFPGWLSSPRWN